MDKKSAYNNPYPLIIGLILTVLGIIIINSTLQAPADAEEGKQTLTALMFLGVGFIIAGILRFRFVLQPTEKQSGTKDKLFAFFLWLGIFAGLAGLHRFYLGKVGTGLLWFFTFGLFGIGQLIDLFKLSHAVDEHNQAVDGQLGHQDIVAIRQYIASKNQQEASKVTETKPTVYTCRHCATMYKTYQSKCSNCGAPIPVEN